MIGGIQQRSRGRQDENLSQDEEKAIRQAMIASLETTRGGSTSRQAQYEEAQPTLVDVMVQLKIMNQNIHGL